MWHSVFQFQPWNKTKKHNLDFLSQSSEFFSLASFISHKIASSYIAILTVFLRVVRCKLTIASYKLQIAKYKLTIPRKRIEIKFHN